MKRFACLIILFFLAVPVFADRVYLDSGEVVRGTIVSEDDTRVIMRTYQGKEEIYRAYIKRIVRTDCGASASSPPAEHREDTGGTSGGSAGGEEDAFETMPGTLHLSHTSIKFALDTNGSQRVSGSLNYGGSSRTLDASEAVETAVSVSGEHVTYVSPNVGLGFGLTYQSPRELSAARGKFSFIPLYGFLKVRSTPSAGDCVYALGHLGYNLFSGDSDYTGASASLSNGVYYGVGGGTVLGNRFQVEVLYTVNAGSITDTGYTYDNSYRQYVGYSLSKSIEYSKLLLSVGLVF